MKNLFIFILLLPILSFSQNLQPKYNWKKTIISSSLSFVSGASWGLHETLQHHNDRFFQIFPNASKKYFGKDSWKNKYHDKWFIPTQISDGLHLSATIHHTTLFSSGIVIGLGKKRPIKYYLIDIGINLISYTLGNMLVYDVMFRKKS